MDYKYEYGRYKKKVADQQKEIAELQGYIDGMKQVLQANDAIIAAILVETSSYEDDPITVKRETVNEALRGGYKIMSRYDEDSEEYELWYYVPKEVKGDEREGEAVPAAEL